jgi:hypothetical protein
VARAGRLNRAFSLPLSQIGNWPCTCASARRRQGGSLDETQLREAINRYLEDPEADRQRKSFIAQECTFTDGEAGKRTRQFLFPGGNANDYLKEGWIA